jgi:hypothetical protein
MAQVGEVKDRDSEKLESCAGCGSLVVFKVDAAGDDLPVGMGKTAVGHRAIDDAIFSFAGLEKHPAGK